MRPPMVRRPRETTEHSTAGGLLCVQTVETTTRQIASGRVASRRGCSSREQAQWATTFAPPSARHIALHTRTVRFTVFTVVAKITGDHKRASQQNFVKQ